MKLSIKTRMVALYMIIILVPITILGFMSFNKTKTVLLEELKYENARIIKHINDGFLNDFLNMVESTVYNWAKDPRVINWEKQPKNIDAIRESWTKFMDTNNNLKWIYLGTESGRFFVEPNTALPEGYDPRVRPWYKQAISKDGDVVWTEPYEDALTHQITITAAMAVRDKNSGNQLVGVIGVDFMLNRFSEIVDEANRDMKGVTAITDSKGIVLAHMDSDLLGKKISQESWLNDLLASREGSFVKRVDKTLYYINYTTIERTGWKMISFIPTDSMLAILMPIQSRTFWVAFFAAIFAILLGIRMSNSIYRNIDNLMTHLVHIENGDLSRRNYRSSYYEFGELRDKINSMSDNLGRTLNEVKQLSQTDGLTQLDNHKFIVEKLEDEIARAKRMGTKLSVIMGDLDHFKEINDLYGHLAGDDTLVAVSRLIRQSLREIDSVGRYGGEEFLILLPDTDAEAGFAVAERIRREVAALEWEAPNRNVTISLGVKMYEGETPEELIGLVDRIMYQAKKNGRNRTER